MFTSNRPPESDLPMVWRASNLKNNDILIGFSAVSQRTINGLHRLLALEVSKNLPHSLRESTKEEAFKILPDTSMNKSYSIVNTQ